MVELADKRNPRRRLRSGWLKKIPTKMLSVCLWHEADLRSCQGQVGYERTFAPSHAHWASLPQISLALCFLSASLSQLAHYAAYLRLYP